MCNRRADQLTAEPSVAALTHLSGRAELKKEESTAEKEDAAMLVMRRWFYPGDKEGYQFVYPTEQPRTIARLGSVEIPVAPRG